MNPLLRYFLAGLLGMVSYKALNFTLGPDEFVFAKEAVEVVIFLVIYMAVVTLFNWLRAQRKEGAS